METTETKTEMITLNEVNGNIESIRMKVSNCIGSLFTKDDVMKILASIVIEKPQVSSSEFNLAEKFGALIDSINDSLLDMESSISSSLDEDAIELECYDIEMQCYSGNKYEFTVENPTFTIPFQSDIESEMADAQTSILQELKSFKENNLTK